MGIRITVDPYCYGTPHISLGNKVKVVHIESGVDISDVVKNIDISIRSDEFVMAKLECYVGELKMEGVTVEELKDHKMKKIKLSRLKRMIREE